MENKTIRIALAGNPNCGKTTLFNALTGSNQFVGNWPGVTVEKNFQKQMLLIRADRKKRLKHLAIKKIPRIFAVDFSKVF